MKIGIDITVLATPEKTGIAVYTYELLDALIKNDPDDQFILFGFSTIATYRHLLSTPLKKYPNVRLKVIRWPARISKNTFLMWQKVGYPTIEQLIGEVDLFHSFNYYLPPQKKGKTIATVFDLTALNLSEMHLSSTAQLDKMRFKKIEQKADLVITISENSKKDFQKLFKQPPVEVIYPGVSSLFETEAITARSRAEVLKKYELKEGYFLSVATLEPRKNLIRLIEGFLRANLSDPLVLAGGRGWKSNEIIELCKKYPQKIKLLGYVQESELPALYRAACCLVYPSLYEGFGIPVLEAMKAGTAVICSNTSSLPEVGADAVLYIDPMQPGDIAEKMGSLKRSEVLRQKIIKKGLKQAEKFSYQISAEKLLKLYQKLDKI